MPHLFFSATILGSAAALGVLASCAADPAQGSTASVEAGGRASADPEFVAATDAWHAKRLDRLAAPDGWLSLVALERLRPGPNSVGRSPGADVVYPGFAAERVGTIVVEDGRVRFEPAPGVAVGGVPAGGALRTDAQGEPTVLSLGDVRFHIIVRGGAPWVRIKDAAAPTRTGFAGIERFPVDESWRIVASFEPAPVDRFLAMDTVIGVREEGRVAGRARFERDGAKVDAVLLDAGDGGSLLRFGDASNGKTTYAVGRYLYVEPSPDGKTVVLDFNRSYNPPCAFTPFATCTIPPESNEFPFEVSAGERWDNAAK